MTRGEAHVGIRIAGIAAGLACCLVAGVASAEEDACRAALARRIETCTASCFDKARAALAPEVRARIKDYGCRNNCTKLEMFSGHRCP